jgi:hypothetical protein
MTFDLYPPRLELRACEPIHFPPGKAGNLLRGALGTVLDARLFRPVAEAGPSGLKDPPRPYAFRVSWLDGVTIPAGKHFFLGVNIFDTRPETLNLFLDAFENLASAGIGPGRGKAKLLRCTGSEILRLDLEAWPKTVSRIRISFVTPTALKTSGSLSASPDFAVLFARARDRVSTLRALYGEGPLEIDFRDMGKRAGAVRITRCELGHRRAERRSTGTGQVHPMGGFTGEVEYEGDLAEFLPVLRAAQWTGVGRHTAWGNGEIAVHVTGT